MPSAIPNALTIAGVDPSGGAGILADIKTFSALGVYGCAVVAALTAQNTRAVTAVMNIPPSFLAQQIDTLFADVKIAATKIGMLGEAAAIEAVAERLTHWRAGNLVLDPVMVAKSGDALLVKAAVGALREALLPLAHVITPNLPEAAVLLEGRPPESLKEMTRAAERLHGLMGSGERWVLLKGGHLPGDDATDLLFNGDKMHELNATRVATRNTHGTGCTLAAALTALIGRGGSVPVAARRAKSYLSEALRRADELDAGTGHGPVHHFHALWPSSSPGG